MSAGRILIAEDEPLITSFLVKGLRKHGFATTATDDGNEALRLADSNQFDLLVLDVGLPGRDGLSVLRELRARGKPLPVVVITARADVAGTVAGLEAGADDYIVKPFHFRELLARIRARMREPLAEEPPLLRVGDVSLDLRTRQLSVGSRTVELTDRECGLAEVFFRHPGEVIGRTELVRAVWGDVTDPASNVVEVYVRYLRQKLGPDLITNVRQLGYRFEVNTDDPGPREP